MAGLGDPPALGGPPARMKVRAGEETGPFPVPPHPHTGASGRLPHCWHLNEKVNIEPKILGVAGCGVAGEPRGEIPAWDQLGSNQGLLGEMAPPGCWGKNRRRGSSPHGVITSREGALRSVLRSEPCGLTPLLSAAPGPAPWPGHSGTWADSPLHQGLCSPHGGSPLSDSAFTFQRLKRLFF